MKEQTTYKKDALNRFSVSDAGKQAAGMYDPGYEHDNCGIGSVVNIKGIKTHETVENALKIVENLKHRAGKERPVTVSVFCCRYPTSFFPRRQNSLESNSVRRETMVSACSFSRRTS